MPSHDETSPVAPRAGTVRRPPPARTRSTGGGGRGSGRPPAGGRARTTASRSGGTPPRPPGSRPTGARPAGKGGKPAGKAGRTKKQKRMRRLKIAGGAIAGMLVLLGVFVGVVYASTEVPSPDSITTSQTTVIYYSDGVTEMARLGDENRTNVALDQISEPAQNAVLAAENRSFYSDPGISLTGIIRATWNNLTGGSTQGGSTITQQYVKNAILQNSEQTFSRKFQELFLSIKLDNNYTKQQILENYLNTIYYGRGAYGIEAAANTYFGVPAAELTAQQGAVLAVLIRSPSRYDPEVSPEDALDRWERVLDAMVEEGWLTAEERAASVYPPVLPNTGTSLAIPTDSKGLIVNRVLAEMESKHGYDDQQIYAGGLRITTTIDPNTQNAAETAVDEVMDGEPRDVLRQALVAVDPRTGGVKAYYGGEIGAGEGAIDYARAQRQPGSSVKPYVLATALENGIGVSARRDGSSPQTFPDRPPNRPVRNSGGASCPACTLTEAITRSLNTTFYGLTYELGPQNVRDTMLRATGLGETWESGALEGDTTLADPETGGTDSGLGIGQYEMRPIDQAVGFATLASGGIQRDPYFVAKVADNEGTVLLEYTGDPGEQVIDTDVANDVTFATKEVASYSRRALEGGREVASKTGTVGSSDEDNSDAWMVGYTPSLSAAVWMGSDGNDPIVDVRGRIIYGSGLPGAIWQQFMNTALEGTPEEDLPDQAVIEGDTGEGVPEPTPTPVPTPEAPAPQTTQAVPSETPVETPPPSNTGQPTGQPTGPPTGTQAPGAPSLPGQGPPPGAGPPDDDD